MRIKCGFAEFIDPTGGEAVARGSVSADAMPGISHGPWDGEVRLLRGHEHLLDAQQLLWILRFENGLAHRWIELHSLEQRWVPSGLRATAFVSSCDDEVPPVVTELGGE